MSSFRDGSIVNVYLGEPPTEIKGHEQGFSRPCVVLKYFSRLKLALIIPCTTKTPPNFYFSIVQIMAGTGGLAKNSYALCHQIRTISIKRISAVIGHLPQKDFYKIQSVQADILGI